jgi:hypothetical protein
MTIIHVRPNTASVDFHVQVLGNKLREHRATALAELVEPKHVGAVRHAPAKAALRILAGSWGHWTTMELRTRQLGLPA